MKAFATQPIVDITACMERTIDGARPFLQLALAMSSLTLVWFLYVPVHELLHVAGCVFTGGSVSALEIQPIYGAALLARVFDFVIVGGEYSGRLSGFDTGGSDLVYLATDIAPYLLSIFIGVPLLRLCGRESHPLLLGPAIVIGLAPFYSLIGDYFEMGSILVTRAASLLAGSASLTHEALRSDDLLRVIATLSRAPSELGITQSSDTAIAVVIVALSTVVGLALALSTYWLGGAFAGRVCGIDVAPQSTPDEASAN